MRSEYEETLTRQRALFDEEIIELSEVEILGIYSIYSLNSRE